MRFIDADPLMLRIKEEAINQAESYADRHHAVVLAYGDCYGKIESAPTIDAVEVVRCKDCKHKGGSHLCEDKIYCKRLRCYMEENDFCSYGERGIREDA